MIEKKGLYSGLRAGVLAELCLELLVAGVSCLHDAVANDAGDNATDSGEDEEEGLGIPGLPHKPSPSLALLPKNRHGSLFVFVFVFVFERNPRNRSELSLFNVLNFSNMPLNNALFNFTCNLFHSYPCKKFNLKKYNYLLALLIKISELN